MSEIAKVVKKDRYHIWFETEMKTFRIIRFALVPNERKPIILGDVVYLTEDPRGWYYLKFLTSSQIICNWFADGF